MSSNLHVVILAAGQGKRMRSPLPKVLQPVAGQPLLGHVIGIARSLDPVAVHVVYGHGAEKVKEAFAHQPDLHWALQEQQLGTGHAVQMALPDIPDGAMVLVLLGDAPLMTSDSLRQVLNDANDGLGVLSARVGDAFGYGRIVRAMDGQLERIVEQKDADETELAIHEVNSGVIAAPAQSLRCWLGQVDQGNAQGEFYLTDCVAIARAAGARVSATVAGHADEILGANDRWQLAELERLYQRRQVAALCYDGATVMDPSRVDVRGSVTVDEEVVIDVNTIFEGEVVLGAGVRIGAGCVIRDSQLGPGTRVAPYSVLEGVQTAGDCDIGPFARLRQGTRLGRQTKVGNFVETKKAELGDGSKASHLSYLGDAKIGQQVNIGAGTITCNYDGVNKHLTVIEDGVFVGSDTQLVAPVTVGAGATLGAGTTLTHDAPTDSLTISRVRQTVIEGWQKPVKKS
ncbi:MAG: bifunctional UDP-N-acetylglucosamine diphosphorylase/glucosamine-1-phosphate N-acetyltransferase GlmU [Lysobacterales bacterium]